MPTFATRPQSLSRARRAAALCAMLALALLALPAAAQAALFAYESDIGGLDTPTGVATDSAGRVYVVDSAAHHVVVFDTAREGNRHIATFGGDKLTAPLGIAIDNRNRIFVTDPGRNMLHMFGSLVDGFRYRTDLGGFAAPRHLAVDRTAQLYVAQRGTVPPKIEFIDIPRSRGERTVDNFFALEGVARDRVGRLTASNDDPNGAIRGYDTNGVAREIAGPGAGPGQVSHPRGLQHDPIGRLLVADAGNGRVQGFASWEGGSGFLAEFGTSGSGPGQFGQPADIAYARGADVYVSDPTNHRVVRLRYDDDDDDGAIDARDNCLGFANPNQRNNDRDGAGDPCDADDDNDGIIDDADACPLTRRGPDANGDGCGDPRSRVKYPSSDRARFRARRAPRRISGIASADVLGVDRVEVAVALVSGGSCRWYEGDGGFGSSTSCDNPVYLRANGTRRWALPMRLAGRGSYRAFSRAAQNGSGLVEGARNSRNTRSFRVR